MSTILEIGGGIGGVGIGTLNLTAKLQPSTGTEADVVSFILRNRNSPVYYEEKDLANGDNTLNIPGGATNKVAGVLLVPDPEMDFQAILKAVSTAADGEGLKLAKRAPTLLSFETPALPDGTNAVLVLKWAGYGKLDAAVTADAGTDKIALGAHGMANGTRVKLRFTTGGSMPGGLNADTLYYIVGAAAGDFQLATSLGGTAIDITTTGSNVKLSTVDKYRVYWF